MNKDELKRIKPDVIKYYNKNKSTKTLPEIAEKFDVKYNTLYRWVQGGRIKNEETLIKDKERAKIKNNENLSSIDMIIESDFVDKFKLKCAEKGLSQAEVVREYIEIYIGKKESDFE